MDKQTFLSSYEKDGYQVIDSFIYDNIKTFLERNKPRKNHIIWIVFISGFFILFFIGFAMGKLWSDSFIFLTIRDTDIEMCRIFYSGLCSDNSGT